MGTVPMANGDLNNTAAARALAEVTADAAYRDVSFAIPASEDDVHVRKTYRPFLLDSAHAEQDWVARLELSTALKMVESQILKSGGERLRILVLHGSMRKR
jgi:arsenic resistance protein ArsH